MTDGQRLYEIQHPKMLVVYLSRREKHPIYIENPQQPVPWHLLTERCRQKWEAYAPGHNLICSK